MQFVSKAEKMMKRIGIIIVVLSLYLGVNAQSWVKEKAKDGITVYSKSTTEYRMKASRAEMIVNAPVETVVNAVYDVKGYLSWMPDCAKIEVLKTISSNELIYYGLYETPWPAASRDLVINVKKIPVDGGYKIVMTNKSNYVEVSSEAVRVPIYFGEWKIVKTSAGTKVTIEYQTDPGGSVPDWMIQGASTKTPFDMFEALKNKIS